MSQQRHPGVDSDAVLDAAAACYLRFGVAKTTAADIAQGLGISRATLYRRFGSHEAIFLAVLARESAAMAADAEVHLAGDRDPVERILEGMMFAIEEIGRARSTPRCSAATRRPGRPPRPSTSRPSVASARPASARCWPASLADGSVSEQDMSDLVDWILRILISYAAVPGDGGRQPDEIRRQLAAWFLPAFRGADSVARSHAPVRH